MTDEVQGAAAPRLGFMADAVRRLEFRLDAERDRLFLWLPVLFGVGIAVYFALPAEPPLVPAVAVAVAASVFVWRLPAGSLGWVAAVALCAVVAGHVNAQLRTMRVAAPVVAAETGVVTISGRVESWQGLADGSFRLVLEPREIERVDPADLPERISLRVRVRDVETRAGEHIRFAGVLMPPPDPTEPGGFDYARQSYFARVGAVGYSVSPFETMEPDEAPRLYVGAALAVERLRSALAAHIEASVGGEAGGIAAALVTGYRGGIPEDAQVALRSAGLAHILAISGLHMMLVVGTIFIGVRALFALSQRLALTQPIKKWAAAVALVGGALYLVISGGAIATQRAFIMAAIMLVAVLVDRPAITLRNVAIAALAILLVTPEALVSASFQMSFAATAALVAGYEAMRDMPRAAAVYEGGFVRRVVGRYLFGLVMTALIAGLATGPYAAFHFNRVAVYSLAGNVLAMPFVGTLVMPFALIGTCLIPFGLDAPFFWVMGKGIDLVVFIARTVAAWDGAVHVTPSFSAVSLGAMTLGALWAGLWRGRWRRWGLVVGGAGLALAAMTPRPDVYISRDAGMVALREPSGGLTFLPRATSRYVAEQWLLATGDDGMPGDDALTEGRTCDPLACIASIPGLSMALVTHPAAFAEECRVSDVVVSRLAPPAWCADHALVIGPNESRAQGATTLRVTENGVVVDTVGLRQGGRPWSTRIPGAVPAGAGPMDDPR